jgi:hypothetical protein
MKYAVEVATGAKFHKDWFRHSKVDREDTHTYGHTRVQPSFIFSEQIKYAKNELDVEGSGRGLI